MNKQNHDEEPVGYLLGTGTWLDWLPKLPRPLIAFGKKNLYSVLLNGEGFALPIDGSKDTVVFIQQDMLPQKIYGKLKKLREIVY